MTTARNPVTFGAELIVDTVRALARNRFLTACVALGLLLVVAGGYILVGALQINPARPKFSVRVELPYSGGLLPNQDVTLRGVPIGRVTSVRPKGAGVEAIVSINADAKIPQNTPVRVSGLSPAGEQYLDFRPSVDHGATLVNGSTVDEPHTSVPIPLPNLLSDMDGMLAQIEPAKFSAILNELRVGPQGPQKLAAIFDGGALLITTLDSVLPQTISTLRDSRIVATTFAAKSPGAKRTLEDLENVLHGAGKMDGGFRTLVNRGGGQLSAVDNVLSDNSDTMVQLLGNLTTVAHLSYLRVPALKALFPTYRGSVIEALGTALHDDGGWLVGSAYPRYSCDYNLPRAAPTVADFPEPFLYTYCPNPDPTVLIRGARNAPRPPGDDTAGPPSGADPLKKTDPIPVGPWTLPTPYGGPSLPQPMPSP
jgi:virulence factor Mce-like protein